MGGIAAVVVIVVVAIIWIAVSSSKKTPGSGGAFDQAYNSGTPARGILLWVAPRGTPSGTAARRFQLRQVKIDIEIPGQPPYVVDGVVTVPMNLVKDVLPGATLEVRVDSDGSVTIVGPGAGFSPMALLAQVSTPPGNS